jgi:hypothetical protein
MLGTLLKIKVIFAVGNDIKKRKKYVCNGNVINYVILPEGVKYFSHKPQCHAVKNCLSCFRMVRL